MATIQEQTNLLLQEQAKNWPLFADNLEGLKSAQIKTFQFDGFSFKVQFNPKRITSSAAKVDKKSIEERKCFLCAAHRPAEQNQVAFKTDYEILCNPFPIFKEHYTIAHKEHIPQEIETSFSSFLDISKVIPDLVTFYNAPNCGASAPDHLHFQAGNKGFMPIEDDYETIVNNYGNTLNYPGLAKVTAVNDSLRTFISIESDDKLAIEKVFSKIYQLLNLGNTEPMLNILSWYNSHWRVLVMLRGKHRPWQFFEEGDKNILLSPASVDMGGTLITPLEKDFSKITKADITDIMSQVSFSKEQFSDFVNKLSQQLA